MANRHIVREREADTDATKIPRQGGARGKIVAEIMGDIQEWRKLRDGDFADIWDEYYAKWRGFWMPQHKSYKTERSKLISPLTSMSIDLTSAEIVEAMFGREYFIDLPDDILDAENDDVAFCRDKLVEDLKNQGFVDEFALTALNGCLYGTGIMKVSIGTAVLKRPYRKESGEIVAEEYEVVTIKPVCIDPDQFVPDPACRNIDDMKGCAHEFQLPLHTIEQRKASGTYYRDVQVGSWDNAASARNRGDTENSQRTTQTQSAFITEYYGLIPARLLLQCEAENQNVELSPEMIDSIPESDMIEVIATIANESQLLRVIRNPLVTGERLMMAYQHECVPGRFWGRGVAEKGNSVQRAMDAEMRARIDGLAWSNNPMFAGDLTRMPPGSNLSAWPGKFWGTRGNPGEVIQEFKISGPDQNTYAHIQDLERMGQQATGALDSAGLRSGMRDETATGSALGASSFIKRSKRTMYNIEQFMNRLIRRTLRLKMQFEPDTYPQDYDFSVRGSIGIMARELEQQFMVNLVSVLGPDSPASMPIIRAIFEHSGSPVKAEVLAALRALEEKKPSPEEEAARAAQLALPVKQVQKLDAEIQKLMEQADLADAQADKTREESGLVGVRQGVEKLKALVDVKSSSNQDRQMDILENKNRLEAARIAIEATRAKQDANKGK